jgi:hypothetical protein
MAFAAYLVYETRVRRTLESYQGDATVDAQENRQKAGEERRSSKKMGLTRLLGIVPFWVAAPAVLLTPLSAAQKAWARSAFLVLGEGAFWAAAVTLGREIFRRYRRFLDSRSWLGNKGR